MVGRMENSSTFPVNVNHSTGYKTARVKSNLGNSDVDTTQEMIDKKNKSHSNRHIIILGLLAFPFNTEFSKLGYGFSVKVFYRYGRKTIDCSDGEYLYIYIYIIMLRESRNTVCETEIDKVTVSGTDVNFLRERCYRWNSARSSHVKNRIARVHTHTRADPRRRGKDSRTRTKFNII